MMIGLKETFVSRVWEKLLEKGMSLKEFSEKMKLTQWEVDKMVSVCVPDADLKAYEVLMAAKVLNTTVEFLMGECNNDGWFSNDDWRREETAEAEAENQNK